MTIYYQFRRYLCAALGFSAVGGVMFLIFNASTVSAGEGHEIFNVQADIRDLDVGDLVNEKAAMNDAEIEENPEDDIPFQMGGQTKMLFVTLQVWYAVKMDKENEGQGNKILAKSWQGLLQSGGAPEVKVYAADADKVLFVTNSIQDLMFVRKFALEDMRDYVDWLEIDNNKMYPPGRSASLVDDNERKDTKYQLEWEEYNPKPVDPSTRVTKPAEPPLSQVAKEKAEKKKKEKAKEKKKKKKAEKKKRDEALKKDDAKKSESDSKKSSTTKSESASDTKADSKKSKEKGKEEL